MIVRIGKHGHAQISLQRTLGLVILKCTEMIAQALTATQISEKKTIPTQRENRWNRQPPPSTTSCFNACSTRSRPSRHLGRFVTIIRNNATTIISWQNEELRPKPLKLVHRWRLARSLGLPPRRNCTFWRAGRA